MAEGLTKKQQKALAFKSKQKSKRRGDGEVEQEDVPEQDIVDDEGNEVPAEEAKVEVKKSKKDKEDKEVEGKEPVVDAAEESEKKKGKRKKTAWDDEEEEAAEGEKPAKKSKKDVTQRFILFVGKLSFWIPCLFLRLIFR
jgi:nucleolar protein 6